MPDHVHLLVRVRPSLQLKDLGHKKGQLPAGKKHTRTAFYRFRAGGHTPGQAGTPQYPS